MNMSAFAFSAFPTLQLPRTCFFQPAQRVVHCMVAIARDERPRFSSVTTIEKRVGGTKKKSGSKASHGSRVCLVTLTLEEASCSSNRAEEGGLYFSPRENNNAVFHLFFAPQKKYKAAGEKGKKKLGVFVRG